MTDRAGRPGVFWPLRTGRIVTSPFGQRGDEWHAGTDFGFPGRFGRPGRRDRTDDQDTMSYGLPNGTNIPYGANGFPSWVTALGKAFGLQASTYPDHQESERAEAGYAPNPQRLNRGIDWTGPVDRMQKFAEYLLSVRSALEQVIWENPNTGQRVGVAGGDDVTTTVYYADDYSGHRDHVHTRVSQPIPLPTGVTVTQPDYNEYWVQSRNSQSRNGTPPTMFLIHTQEGDGNADSLARYLCGPNGVSYHYTISEDYNDHGVTVCDVVDTDLASWSVLDYNNRSINLCFAGSRAGWSRDQWMQQQRAIDVAAYLAVQDCLKYNFSSVVVPPPYRGTPGISDHAYVTHMGVGTHTDVGPNFPWDYFTQRVDFYAGRAKPAPTPPPVQPPTPVPPADSLTARVDRLERAVADLQAKCR